MVEDFFHLTISYYREYKKQASEIAFQFVMTSFVKS